MCMVHPSAMHCIPMLLTHQEHRALVRILPAPGGSLDCTLAPVQHPGGDLLTLPSAGARVPLAALPGWRRSPRHS